jgi:hypothetical protein
MSSYGDKAWPMALIALPTPLAGAAADVVVMIADPDVIPASTRLGAALSCLSHNWIVSVLT